MMWMLPVLVAVLVFVAFVVGALYGSAAAREIEEHRRRTLEREWIDEMLNGGRGD